MGSNKRNGWFNGRVLEAIRRSDSAYGKYLLTDLIEDWEPYKLERNRTAVTEIKVQKSRKIEIFMWKTLKRRQQVILMTILLIV